MIKNTIVKCNFCEEKIFLRFQLGCFDIPFDFYCPNCGVSVSGALYVSKNHFIVKNALEIEEDIKNVKFYGNFSTEFLNKKISEFSTLEDIVNDGFSPFMSTMVLFENDERYMKIINNVGNFYRFKKETWINLIPLYELFFNYKLNLIKKPLLKFSQNYIIKNELDAMISLHQLTLLGMNFIMPTNTLYDYIEISKKIFEKNNLEKTFEFISFLNEKIKLNSLSEKVIEIYKKWIVDFEKYMAVIILSMGEKNELVDRKSFGISTINFEDMKSFFVNSYELILELITLPIGLNNIILRNHYDNFSEESCYKNFKTYFEQSKFNRLKSLVKDEPYSKYLDMNRHIRNSIAHYDYKLNKQTQIITFFDKYGENTETIEMYLFDFALLCYENIKVIIYMNELLYNIRKLDFIKKGIKSNINPNFKKINIVENELCI